MSLGPEIDFKKLDKNTLLRRSCIIYGQTASGKTTIVQDILHTLKNDIGLAIVFCPTDGSHKTYSGRGGDDSLIPTPFIHYTVNDTILTTICEHQEAVVHIYKQANRMEILQTLFARIMNNDDKVKYGKLITFRDRSIEEMKRDNKSYLEFEEETNEIIQRVMRDAITREKQKLGTFKDLTTDEKYSLLYYDINPNIIVIMDDITSEMSSLKKSKAMQRFFFEGRHLYITLLTLLHDDTTAATAFRTNAHISIYTDQQTAKRCIHREKRDRKDTEIMNSYIGKIVAKEAPYTKLMYITKEMKWYLYRAETHGTFKFCSPIIREYCNQIKSGNNSVSNSNQFIRKFKSQLYI